MFGKLAGVVFGLGFWVRPIYMELLHASSRLRRDTRVETARPSTGLVKILCTPKAQKEGPMNATLHNTLFLRDEVQKERMVYVEFPSGIYAVKVEDYEKWEELRAQEEDDRSFFEAFILQNKANGKELDPRYFDETERLAFQEADKKEWFSWIKNRVVRRLSDQEAAKVDRRLIFKAPADGSCQQRGHGGCLTGKIKIGYPWAFGSSLGFLQG